MTPRDTAWFNEGMRIRSMYFKRLARWISGGTDYHPGGMTGKRRDGIMPHILGKDCWEYPKDRYGSFDWGCEGPELTRIPKGER